MIVTDDSKKLRDKIEAKIGTPIADVRFYATGQNASLYLVDLDDQRRLMVKNIGDHANVKNVADLEVEGWMLHYLSRKTKLPIPHVYWYDKTTIMMNFVEDSGTMNAMVQEDAAQILAELHSVRSEFFGLERDTAVASFIQPNHFELSWIDFFREYRLLSMARECLNDGVIDAALMAKIEKLAGKLGQYIENKTRPGLIHGDLWSGNILLGKDRIRAFLDPAIYFADPEMELAGIACMGTFGEAFFKRYHEISPIGDGFHEVRRDLYALYNLLVLVRLGYRDHLERIESTLKRLVG